VAFKDSINHQSIIGKFQTMRVTTGFHGDQP